MGNKIKTFEDLDAWKVAHDIGLSVYNITKSFPSDELFALTSQLRRAAISITSNIAEGFSRQSYKEKIQFYSMALGSLTEVKSQLIMARDLNYLLADVYGDIDLQIIRLHKLVNGLIKASRQRLIPNS